MKEVADQLLTRMKVLALEAEDAEDYYYWARQMDNVRLKLYTKKQFAEFMERHVTLVEDINDEEGS